MKVLKPSWVTHDDQPIFSIDVHPDSSRFATGGQGFTDKEKSKLFTLKLFDYCALNTRQR
jgi:protein HIRA/HIR1